MSLTTQISSLVARIGAEFKSVRTAIAAVRNNTALTGVPTAPTAAPGTATLQVATTAFVAAAASGGGGGGSASNFALAMYLNQNFYGI